MWCGTLGNRGGEVLGHTIRVVEDDRIIEIRISGVGDLEEHAAIRDEAVRLCSARKINRILVDLRKAMFEMSAVDKFEFGKSFGAAGFPVAIRIAAVATEEHSAVEFIAAMAQARAFSLRVFLDEDEARGWLKGGQSSGG
jgi:hypothetical protein